MGFCKGEEVTNATEGTEEASSREWAASTFLFEFYILDFRVRELYC